jgi:hypothetical protein
VFLAHSSTAAHSPERALPKTFTKAALFCPAPAPARSNTRLSEQYLSLARDLDVMEAKAPEDVYKMHLVDGRAPAGELGWAEARGL